MGPIRLDGSRSATGPNAKIRNESQRVACLEFMPVGFPSLPSFLSPLWIGLWVWD